MVMELVLNKSRYYWNILKICISLVLQHSVITIGYFYLKFAFLSVESILIIITYLFVFFVGTLPDITWFISQIKYSRRNHIHVNSLKKSIRINNKIYSYEEIKDVNICHAYSPFRIQMVGGYYYQLEFSDSNTVIIPNLRLNSKTKKVLIDFLGNKLRSLEYKSRVYWWR
jgi:hypothetical protein